MILTPHHFDENSVTMLAWPPKSPDLNPIENIWGQIESHKNTNLVFSLNIPKIGENCVMQYIQG